MKKVILYTDGACSGNPGVGGWGAVLMFNGHEKRISGVEGATTNNRMEITAVIEGLKCLKEPCCVDVTVIRRIRSMLLKRTGFSNGRIAVGKRVTISLF